MAKLVEILARELKEWPEGVTAIEQSHYGLTLYERRGPSLAIHVSEIAEDSEKGVVTRAEWQAAVDALKAKEAVEWDGVGLPPVGVSCERRFPDVRGSSWNGCIILAHGARRIFVRDNCGDEWAPNIDEVEFRPFRTSDRIAAYELRAIIESGLDGRKTLDQVIEEIIGAGYRKQGQK